MEQVEEGKGLTALLHWNALMITVSLSLALAAVHLLTKSLDYQSLFGMVVLIAIALALLVTSADFFIEGAKSLARRAGIAEVIIGLTIVSIGTSLPEILVTATAAKNSVDDPSLMDLAIGNIYGSVLVQITLILGIVVLFKPLQIRPNWLRRDGLLMLGAAVLLSILLLQGGGLSRLEGGFLVSLYIGYIVWLLRNKDRIRNDELELSEGIQPVEYGWTTLASLMIVVIGLSMAVYAASHLVLNASKMAVMLNVPHAIVGTVVSGIGTSLPELTVALMAAKKSQGVAIGTLIGSNITDPLLSIGIAAMINPLTISASSYNLTAYLIIPATLLGISFCLAMMWTGFEFQRWEGGILVAFYLFFIVLLEMQRRGLLAL
ncbi:MAG: calcium/sodium antiporter [Candidatus Poseidoniales archaeon]